MDWGAACDTSGNCPRKFAQIIYRIFFNHISSRGRGCPIYRVVVDGRQHIRKGRTPNFWNLNWHTLENLVLFPAYFRPDAMWIPDAIYSRLPLLYGCAGAVCLLAFETGIASVVSAGCLFVSAQLTRVWRRRHSVPKGKDLVSQMAAGASSRLPAHKSRTRSAEMSSYGSADLSAYGPSVLASAEADEKKRIETQLETQIQARFPSQHWSAAFLRTLSKQPLASELISLAELAQAPTLSPASSGTQFSPDMFTVVAGALLGSEGYRGCLASRLPVYLVNETQAPPALCTDSALRLMLMPAHDAAAGPLPCASALAIHRNAAAMAFRMPPANGAAKAPT